MAVRGKGDAGVCGQCRQVRSLKVNGSGDPERISISKLVPGFLKFFQIGSGIFFGCESLAAEGAHGCQ